METIYLTYPHHLKKESIPPAVAAIGFFDGIHRGHQEVIQRAIDEANKKQLEKVVITFYPHPSVVLKNNGVDVQYLSITEEKEAYLKQLGVDKLYIINFNKELSSLTPDMFLQHFIADLHIKHLVAGFDYTFGFKGAGNMENIVDYLPEGIDVSVVDKVELKSEKISSTNIRKALETGSMEQVSALLGRPYYTTGQVITGDKRGRQIGFPTANLEVDEKKLLPKQGVYGVYIYIDNKRYQGLLNLGVKPTFHDDLPKPVPEVYILDFTGDIYGKTVYVEWLTFVRDEKKFNGIDEIVAQLKNDEKSIREFFEKI